MATKSPNLTIDEYETTIRDRRKRLVNTQLGIPDEIDATRSPVRQNSPTASEASRAAMGNILRENKRMTVQRRAITKQWDVYMTGKTQDRPAPITGHETWKANLRSKPPRTRDNPAKKRKQSTTSVGKELQEICNIRAHRFSRKNKGIPRRHKATQARLRLKLQNNH